MKNISLTINPNAITSIAPPTQPYPAPPFVAQPKQIHSLSFSAQFETEAECLNFTNKLLGMVNGDQTNA